MKHNRFDSVIGINGCASFQHSSPPSSAVLSKPRRGQEAAEGRKIGKITLSPLLLELSAGWKRLLGECPFFAASNKFFRCYQEPNYCESLFYKCMKNIILDVLMLLIVSKHNEWEDEIQPDICCII